MKIKQSFLRFIKPPRFSGRFFNTIATRLRDRRKVLLISSGSFLSVAILIIGTFLPTLLARAEQTLTWTSNADFSYNKITGKCSPIVLEGLEVEGGAYTDENCLESEADAALKLASSSPEMKSIVQISSSSLFTLALASDGTVWAWGSNENGQLGSGATYDHSAIPVKVKNPSGDGDLTGVTHVSAGVYHACAIASNQVYCWGSASNGRLGNNATSGTYSTPVAVDTSVMTGTVTAISAGSSHTCAIADGQAYCWGSRSGGAIGDGSTTSGSRVAPVAVNTAGALAGKIPTSISAGNGYTCVVASGQAYCWGGAANGKLGNNITSGSYSTPVAVDSSVMTGTVTAISTGSSHTCAIADGKAYCWGNASNGVLGNNVTSGTYSTPVAVDSSVMTTAVTSILSSDGHTCAIADGQAYCWGSASNGKLGNNAASGAYSTPVAVDSSVMTGTVTAISTGSSHTCAIADAVGYCWGNNERGSLGLEKYGDSAVSIPVSTIEKASFENLTGSSIISNSQYNTCAVVDGKAYCWGHSSNGKLGDGVASDNQSLPVGVNASVMSGVVTDISTGDSHSCAISDGNAYCWGSRSSGKLGDGSTSGDQPVPVAVNDTLMSGDITDISVGSTYTCAISNDKAYCWGSASSGRLGNNVTSGSYSTPVAVDSSVMTGTVTAISTGSSHTCAIADGKAYCWGNASNGVLGNNVTSGTYSTPVAVDTSVMSGTVTAISTGSSHTCAIADGKAYCWGSESSGKLGNNATSGTYSTPVAVDASAMTNTVTSISAGGNHTCAVSNHQAYCWGSRTGGVLGDDSSFGSVASPAAVNTSIMTGQVSSISAGSTTTCAISSTQAYCWGNSSYGKLGVLGYDSVLGNVAYPRPGAVTKSLTYSGGFDSSGTMNGAVVDAGQGKKTKWYSIAWEAEALPENTSISFSARTSDDNSTWSAWTSNFTQDADGSTSGFGSLDSLPMSRYIEIRAELTSDSSSSTPTLNDFTLSFLQDEQPPEQNASNLTMQRQKDDSAVSPEGWTNLQTPYFAWDAAEDNVNGSGIQGYCLYLGRDESADPTQTKGLLGDSPVNTGGACPYAVSGTHIDFGVVGALASELETSSDPYIFLVSAIDFSGNVYAGDPASFSFRYDDEPPRNPSFISAPSQFVSTKEVTLTWPTSGAESAQDSDSGIAGLQYRIGSGGVWYGDSHTGEQNAQDLLENDGTYVTDETYDYPELQEGNNIIYFRTYDRAGNVSESHITTVVKINTSSPTSPQNLTATPTTNTSNSFAFNWLAPASFVGHPSSIVYCYTVNVLPNSGNCNYTNPGQRSLPADAFATQPGVNTFYVVARDEANNINYDTYASVAFTANTPAPGIVRDFEIADVSTKASSLWKLAISWSEPENTGAGVSKYVIERSTNGTNFAQVASTSGLSYVDSGLSQQQYFYKVRACDSANNCGAFSESTSMTPTGRFTTPAELVGNVTSQVGTRTARFAWATDRNSDSRIQHGTTSGVYLPSEVTVSDQTQAHELELFNLEAGTTYYYKVKWTDEDGNTGVSSELSFTTLPAPSIKDVKVVKKNLTSAIVQFTSTEATKVELLYGKSDSFGGVKTINTSRNESTYLVELTGLDDGSNYSFRLNTFDSEGNKYDSNRTDSFETPPRPRISNLRFQPVPGQPTSTQEITWNTNVPADSTITYGKIGTNGTDVYSSQKTSDHKIVIKGLEDDSNYFLLAQSRDADGNLAISDRQVFRTALDTRAPSISDIKVTTAIKGSGGDARGQIVVYWKTDEPSTSQVAYGLGASGTDFPNRTAQDNQLTTDHVVIISDLPVANVYYLQPVSSDRSNNTTSGDSRSAVIGRPTDSILTIIINSIQSILGI